MPATITATDTKSLYLQPGKNYAPKKPWDEMRETKRTPEPTEFTDAIRKKYEEYIKRDDSTWIDHCESGRQVANLREGKMLLLRNVNSGRLMFVKREGIASDNKTQGGQFQFYSTKITSEWVSSKPDLDPVAQSEADQIEALISAVKVVQDNYSRKFFDDNYETNECLSAQDFGTYITRYRYDPYAKDIVCELLDFPACRWDIRRRCEDSEYFIYESKCSTAKLEHLLNCDISSDGDEGDHYGLDLIEMIAKQGSNTSGYGKERPYGTYGDNGKENVMIEMWLQPDAYCDITLSEDEPTIGGKKLKKGTSLLEMFPDGMCVVGMNNMKTIIGLYAENHREHIVVGLYHVQSFCGVGKGISDAVDVQKDINNFRSQMMAFISGRSTPATYYNKDLITEADARDIGKPKKAIPIDFKNAPDGVTSINQAIQTLASADPGRSIFEMNSMLQNDLQMSMQVTDFSNGLPGVDNKTATGAKIGDANAEMILVPQHRLKADHRRRSFKVIYNLFKKYMDAEKWFPLHDKNGITDGKTISSKDFEGVDIDFEVVANSEVPKTPLQESQALAQVLQFTGGVMGLLQAVETNPDITGEIVNAFGASLSIPDKKEIARVCRRRINQAKELLQRELGAQEGVRAFGIEPDNSDLARQIVSQINPPISPQEPYFKQKATWMGDLLDSDEMQYAPDELRYVVEELIAQQIRVATFGNAEREQDANLGAVVAELPYVLGEQAMSQQAQSISQEYEQQKQQAEMQQQQQDAMMQNQQALQMEQQKAQIQATQSHAQQQQAAAQADRQHAQTSQLAERQHAMAMAQGQQGHKNALQLKAIEALGKIDAEKAKAKKPMAKAA